VTNVGFNAMTLKLNSNHRRSGGALLHLGQKKLDKSRAALSPCWSFFCIDDIFNKKFISPVQKVNKESCHDILGRLREDMR
jgi:hypothetical protein